MLAACSILVSYRGSIPVSLSPAEGNSAPEEGTLFFRVVLVLCLLLLGTLFCRVVLLLCSHLETPPNKQAKEQTSLLCLDFRIMAGNISGSISIAAASHNIAPQSWVLDSGASFHGTSNKTQLIGCKKIVDGTTIHTAYGTSCHVTHEGTFSSPHFYVPDISLVPQLSMNLLSVGQIADMNCFVGFDDSSCFIQWECDWG